jgi:hypothetical protein
VGTLSTVIVALLALPPVVLAVGLVAFAWGSERLAPRGGSLPAASREPGDDRPDLSIIVPVRDEEGVIGACVRSLLDQRGVDVELIVVDDGSTDNTPAILADLAADRRFTVLRAHPPERSWLGKTSAVHQGAAIARGRALLFVDADARLHPEGAATALGVLRERGAGLLTLWPRQRVGSLWERLLQPAVIAMFLFADAARRFRGTPFPEALMAWGVFVLVDAERYRRLGGHAHPTVRGAIGDDYRLLRLFSDAGALALAFEGAALVQVRMYHGLRTLWRGWSKHLFIGLDRSPGLTLGAMVLIVGATSTPWLLLVLSLVDPSPVRVAAAALSLAALAAAGLVVAYHVEGHPLTALTPIGGAVAAAIFATSAYLHLSGSGVTWKGRRYGAASDGASDSARGGS